MAATVGATLSGVTFALRHAGEGPFISTAGNVYFFGRDSVNTGNVEPHKASDPTSAFTAQTAKTMSSATSTAIEAMACYQVGQVIHCVAQISTGATYYNFYTMDTDTWGLTTSETAVAAATVAPVTGATFVSLVVRSGGNVVIVYNAGQTAMSSTFNQVFYRIRTGTNTYGTATRVDNAGSVDYTGPIAVLGASDRVHIFLKNFTTNDVYQRTLSAANALETWPSTFNITAGADMMTFAAGVSYTSGANTIVAVPFRGNPNVQSVVRLTSADAPTPAVEAASNQSRFQVNNQVIQALAADGSTLHYLYSFFTDTDLYHDSDGGTGTWGTDVNELAGTINRITSNVYTRSGTKYLAMVLDDGGTVKYAEITLTSPASLIFEPNRTLRLLTLR